MNPGTGCLAMAGRNALGVPRFQVHEVNLEERIILRPFTLENHLLPIGTEISFASPLPCEGKLSRRTEEPLLSFCSIIGRNR